MSWLGSVLRRAPEWSEEDLAHERELLERCAKLLREAGAPVLPYRDPSLPMLRSRRNYAEAMHALEQYTGALEDCARDGVSPRDTVQLIWRFVRRMGFRPESDIFDRIRDTDVVEVYTTRHLQLFRNLRFFDYCSYTLEEIAYCIWNKVSRRSSKVTLRMLGIGAMLHTGRLRSTLDVTDIGVTRVDELMGEFRSLKIDLRYISPLWKGDRVAACLTINQCARV